MARAVGIDLGTTNSVISILEGGEPKIISNAEGHRTTPSVVAFAKNGEVLVGDQAKRQAITNPERTVRSVKRHMGSDWSIEIDGKQYNSQEISARILQKLKRDAEAYLGEDVKEAVVTVPAYFGDAQRQATKEAGQIAGLEVLRIVNEPTAAALAYGLDSEKDDHLILVFDLGGGTFDVSILEIGEGVFEVKSTHGDTDLGGDDWDERVIDWLVTGFKNDHGVDLSTDPMAMTRLKETAEKAKIELSSVQETEINLPFITATNEGPIHLLQTLKRSEFEQMTEDLVERTRGPFKEALEDAGVKVDEIDHVILVGGTTRMPAVQALVEELAGKEPHQGVNPDEVVADGAALQAGVLTGDVTGILLLDVTPLTLGVETEGGVANKMIERNTTIPTRRSEIFTTAADNQPEVEIHVLQGERPMATDNKSLGQFKLPGIAPARRGVPQIEVTFDIDANGIVSVSAKDLGTGQTQQVTITGGTALSDEDIEQMIEDAETHAKEDVELKKAAEARNKADHAAYQIEGQLEEHGDKLTDDERKELEDKVATVRSLLDDETASADALNSAADDLMTGAQVLGQKVYEASQTTPEAAGANDDDSNAEADDVVEAEVVEDDDEA
ncbi:MAG: molecular chaperone DnaK [Actinobacteria bacterium]|nr:molecular chaperone DnaK [Actinomycetota bacterium]